MKQISWLLLLLSLIVNGFLLVTRAKHGEAVSTKPTTPTSFSKKTRLSKKTQLQLRPQHGDCNQALQANIARMQKEIDALEFHLPWSKRFDRGKSNPDAEERLGNEVSRILGPNANVECRSSICKIELAVSREEIGSVSGNLQQDKQLRGMVGGFSFSAPTPTNDPNTGDPLWMSAVFTEVSDTQIPNGKTLLLSFFDQFRNSDAIPSCTSNHQGRGDLEVRMDISQNGEITIYFGGEIGTKPVGKCVSDRLKRAAATAAFSSPVREATVFEKIELTLDM